MKRWKLLVILAAIVSVGIVAAASFLPRPDFAVRSLPHRDLQEFQNYPIIPLLDKNTFIVSSIGMYFSLAIVGILVLFTVPRRIRRMAEVIPASFPQLLRLILLGLIVTVLVAAAGFFSVLAIGTFPLTILLLAGLFAAGLLGMVTTAYVFGRALTGRAGWRNLSPALSFLLGWLILFAPTRIPLAGGLLFLAYACLGLGVTVGSKFGSGEHWNLNSLMEEEKDE